MKKVSLEKIVKWAGGRLSGGGSRFIGNISTDTRNIGRGDLFLALKGDNFDGHSYVEQAAEKGAVGAVVSSGKYPALPKSFHLIRVRDTVRAFQKIAAGYRREFSVPVVGITGSNGKTTTKEFVGVLAGNGDKVAMTKGTENNHIGVPLTLLKLDGKTKLLVVEMGMNHRGEIRRLAEISSPDIGLITNVSSSHLKFLKTVENVAKSKRELLEKMAAGKTSVLNRDDKFFDFFKKAAPGEIISFGLNGNSDVAVGEVKYLQSRTKFELQIRPTGEKAEVQIPSQGQHNLYNCLSAVAVCHVLGISFDKVCARLGKLKLPSMRFERSTVNKMVFINDAYNANPESMRNALAAFSAIKTVGRKLFVCGDMLELGSYSAFAHAQVGRLAAESGVDFLVTIGSLSQLTADAAVKHGMKRRCVRSVESVEDVVQELNSIARPGDSVLLKGSRGMGMERILELIKSHRYHKD
jgi:UDP-N-acetylmuramoyl-tripeptide--D-alanyl-D-alanine ligase